MLKGILESVASDSYIKLPHDVLVPVSLRPLGCAHPQIQSSDNVGPLNGGVNAATLLDDHNLYHRCNNSTALPLT